MILSSSKATYERDDIAGELVYLRLMLLFFEPSNALTERYMLTLMTAGMLNSEDPPLAFCS
jgi:hypothetical protein